MDQQRSVTILGVRIDDVTMAEAVARVRSYLDDGKQHHVVTVNPEFVMEAQKNQGFRTLLNGADLAVPDGIGLKMTAKMAGGSLRSRVAGVDLVEEIAHLAQERGSRLFLFGGGHGVARRAAQHLLRRFPRLTIVGAMNEWSSAGLRRREEDLLDQFRRQRPDILLVALGAPRQEEWIRDHLAALPSVKVAIGVGGTFDFLAGAVRRAPRLLRSLGLEWLWRLLLQPWRIRRIATAVVQFPLTVLRHRT